MRALIALSVLFLASAAHAVDPGVTIASVHSAGQQTCKTNYVDPHDSGQTGIYTGQCTAGVPDGAGVVEFRSGGRYEGNFEQGKMHGIGTLVYASGDRYSGRWAFGSKHGEGTYTWRGGSKYVGNFSANTRQGTGTFEWANGDRFVGEFQNNKYHNGTFYSGKGGIYKCRSGRCG